MLTSINNIVFVGEYVLFSTDTSDIDINSFADERQSDIIEIALVSNDINRQKLKNAVKLFTQYKGFIDSIMTLTSTPDLQADVSSNPNVKA